MFILDQTDDDYTEAFRKRPELRPCRSAPYPFAPFARKSNFCQVIYDRHDMPPRHALAQVSTLRRRREGFIHRAGVCGWTLPAVGHTSDDGAVNFSLDLLQQILDEGVHTKGVTDMPTWLQPWLEPTVLATSMGALFAGLGPLATQLASTLAEVRTTVDWWDERRERRRTLRASRPANRDARNAPARPPEPRPTSLERPPAGRSRSRSAQLTLDLDETVDLDESA